MEIPTNKGANSYKLTISKIENGRDLDCIMYYFI